MYICKLPNLEWINLTMIRTLELEVDRTSVESIVRITWENGDQQTYSGSQATAIIQAWTEIQVVDKSHVRFLENNHA